MLIATKVFGKIGRALFDISQSFARSALCINRVVAFELDMKEF